MQLRPHATIPSIAVPLRRARERDRLVDPRELVLIAVLLGVYALWWADFTTGDYKPINVAGPSALIVILVAGAWWQVRRTRYAIWQPLFWFRIACAAYYGVGALAPYIANDATVRFMKSLYDFNEQDTFTVGLINVLSVLTVLSTAAMISPRRGVRPVPRLPLHQHQRWTLLFATILLIGAGAVRYLIVLPWSLGLTETVPGLVVPLGRSYILGIFLLVLVGLRGNRLALLLAIALAAVELGVDLLTFAKTEVLLTLIFVYLAVLHHKYSLPRVLVGLILVLGVYSQLDPIIHYGRDELARRTGSSARGSLEQRLEILSLYTGTKWQGTERGEIQSPLSRLSYVNAAAMVVNWHDAGLSGSTLSYVLVVLVPRFIWPNKPTITSVGTDLYTAATNQEGVSISPGLFAEGYWNFGWLGIPFLMVPLGAILAALSRYATSVMRDERWLHLPAVLLGVYAGTRVDGWYVPDIVGGCGTAFVYAAVASSFERFMTRRPAGRRA